MDVFLRGLANYLNIDSSNLIPKTITVPSKFGAIKKCTVEVYYIVDNKAQCISKVEDNFRITTDKERNDAFNTLYELTVTNILKYFKYNETV